MVYIRNKLYSSEQKQTKSGLKLLIFDAFLLQPGKDPFFLLLYYKGKGEGGGWGLINERE